MRSQLQFTSFDFGRNFLLTRLRCCNGIQEVLVSAWELETKSLQESIDYRGEFGEELSLF